MLACTADRPVDILAPDESAAELMGRLNTKPLKTGIRFIDNELKFGLKISDVTEIFGGTGSGKTELLLNIAARCITPMRKDDLDIEGLEYGVLYFDNDMRFDPSRLKTLVESRIQRAFDVRTLTPEMEQLVRESLARFEVIQPRDSFQYHASLSYMHRVLQHDPRIKVLMIDSGSAFYYPDRHDDDGSNLHSNKAIELIDRLRVGRFCFITKAQIRAGQAHDTKPDKEYMGPLWERMIRYRITLIKNAVQETFTARLAPIGAHQPQAQRKEFRFRIDSNDGIVQ